MALSTTDVRIESGSMGLFAVSRHLDALLEGGCHWACHFSAQTHEFTGIGSVDGRDRTGLAKGWFPCITEQAAFLMVAPAVVIPIKILAF